MKRALRRTPVRNFSAKTRGQLNVTEQIKADTFRAEPLMRVICERQMLEQFPVKKSTVYPAMC
jgi:hypothetical protein